MLSFFEQAIFTLQHTKFLKKRLKNKQKPTTFLQAKPTAFNKQKPTAFNKQSPQPFYKQKPTAFNKTKSTTFLQAKSTTILQAKNHSHTTSLMLKKYSEKQANPAKYPQYPTL